jgi:hypothetical protein
MSNKVDMIINYPAEASQHTGVIRYNPNESSAANHFTHIGYSLKFLITLQQAPKFGPIFSPAQTISNLNETVSNCSVIGKDY